MTTTDTDSDNVPKPSRTSAYLRALKVPAIFVVVCVGLLGAYYSIYVRNSLEYLKGRDMRLLSTLGMQIQTSLDDHQKILSSFSNYYHGRVFAAQFRCIVLETAGQAIALFSYVSPDLPAGSAQAAAGCTPDKPVEPDKTATGPAPAVHTRFIDAAGTAWTRDNGAGTPPAEGISFRIDLDRTLEPLFTQQVDEDVFDALVLVAPSGRVIYSAGTPHLHLTSLDGILRRQSDGEWKEQPFSGIGRVSQVLDVQISGSQYVLFLQPCCTGLSDSPHVEKDSGWIVAALTESSKLRNASLAVSFSVMAFLAGVILLAIFSWPFLKLTLISEEQRLRLIDVLGVGICGLLGIALVMLFLMDWYSYARLKDDLDAQLEQLSRDIEHNVGQEVSRAYKQLRFLDTWTTTPDAGSGERASRLFEMIGSRREDAPYPFFESFALIAENGMQRHKWAVENFTTPLVSTASREYFRYWTNHDVLPESTAQGDDAEAENAYRHSFLESIRSSTTGRKEAVLSIPTDPKAHADMKVAALAIPMVSLNEVTLPPGFKFAVIDARGRVMFHSDPRHSLDEQFFLETDSSRRLRSAVAARRDEDLNIRYFGQDYRAYVAPLASLNGSSWSVVTFFDRQLLRTVNIEWLVTTMLFSVIYASLYIVFCIIVLLFRPSYRATWIWPDPAKRQDYQHLIVVYAVFVIAFALGIDGLRGRHLLALAWLLPFNVWIATYLTLSMKPGLTGLRRSPLAAIAVVVSVVLLSVMAGAGPRGIAVALLTLAGVFASVIRVGGRVPRPYIAAALLLLILTAVMPTAAFFQVAHTIQVDSYVKYGQLTLAREVQRRLDQARKGGRMGDPAPALRRGLSLYGLFFYGSEVVDASDSSSITKVCGENAARPDALRQDPRYELPKMLEDLLPYYSESSVGMRELLHDRSSDQAWDWHRKRSEIVLHTPANRGWSTACVRSSLPAFAQAGVASFDTAGRGVKLAALGAVAFFTLVWIVRFTTRRIFLIDVIEPLWARRAAAIPMHPGEPLYIVWRPADRQGRALLEKGMFVVDLEKVPEPAREWFTVQRDRLEQLPAGQTVVIDHLDTRSGDPAFDEYKLAVLRDVLDVQHRTVVLVSALRPASLVARIAAGSTSGAALLEQRWTSLLARFTVLEGIRFEGPIVAPATVTAVAAAATSAAAPIPPSAREWTGPAEEGDPVVRSVWQEVSQLAHDDHSDAPLDREQIYEEVGDRLGNYHRGIWESCSDAQKRVLQHLAQEGLVNEKTRRTVRLLLARGLIRKNPDFFFLSETFRRFVLFRVPSAEIAAIDQRATSAWDTVRLPFLITLLAVSAFFFLTQRELFTTTIAVITALAGGIPALVRVAGLFERHPERAKSD